MLSEATYKRKHRNIERWENLLSHTQLFWKQPRSNPAGYRLAVVGLRIEQEVRALIISGKVNLKIIDK